MVNDLCVKPMLNAMHSSLVVHQRHIYFSQFIAREAIRAMRRTGAVGLASPCVGSHWMPSALFRSDPVMIG
jgi:hypothetical protein